MTFGAKVSSSEILGGGRDSRSRRLAIFCDADEIAAGGTLGHLPLFKSKTAAMSLNPKFAEQGEPAGCWWREGGSLGLKDNLCPENVPQTCFKLSETTVLLHRIRGYRTECAAGFVA